MIINLSDTTLGYLWVTGAIFCFGSFGLPIKVPLVQKANIDPVVFQCYYSLAVFITSFCILFFEPFVYTWWGVVGALLWFPASTLAIFTINLIGIAITQGVSGGTTIIVSFFWGSVVFHEVIENWYLTILGLFLLLLGITGISVCNIQIPVSLPSFLLKFEKFIPFILNRPILPIDNKNIQEEITTEDLHIIIPKKNNYSLGLIISVFLGLCTGTMLVPSKLAPEDIQGIEYVFSFAIGVAIITVLFAPVYFIFQYIRGNGLPNFHFKIAVVPGLLAGTIWNVGNICSINATFYLGLTIGFPLTQLALLVSGIWGMLLFKEISRMTSIIVFFTSVCILLGGAVLLSFFG